PIALFEFSERVGGRLFSQTLPGMPHVYAELGGMRFIPTSQRLVANLIEHLRLRVRDFPMGSTDPTIGRNRNYMYLRRRHLLIGELNDSARVPYEVNWSERNMNPDQLQTYVMNLLVPNASRLSIEDWFRVRVFGQELY